ncbi:hypothetical protein SAMN04487835_1649 [Sharpea azabuensis]|uniref:DUF554 domain-containing protein n=1 Tax=Sharpea azabuensis TaxID=322505 RepID=UPI0008EE000E|nr:DUF554 domain-containing protein [Sharpea azabuensis]SFE53005.1 hypothetical protein SAMN04487836_1651 [Sharpea azabuensis]SFL24981.1 hypothetical protein SAMN04487835_1649 [Sharpea azabuensis]
MGAIVNTLAVIAGSVIGLFFSKGIKEKYQHTIMQALGLSTIFIGLGGALEKILLIKQHALSSHGSLLIAISLVLGALIGEFFDIEYQFERLGKWLKAKAKSNDSKFTEAFVSTSLTVCIGAMAIVGSIQDGLVHDPSMLYTKSLLDFIIVIVFASTLGIGSIFAALPILVLEGSLTLFAGALNGILTTAVINNMVMVGNILIVGVGVNLMEAYHIKVANLLPALIIAIPLTYLL